MRRRTTLDKQSRRSGSAIVETAFVVPIFLSLVLGIAEFGRAIMVANLLTGAAREGARLAVIKGVTAQEVKDAVIQQTQQTLGITLTSSDVVVTVTPYAGNPDPQNEPANARTRDLCNVAVTLDYVRVAYVVKSLQGAKLRGQAAMRHE